jgi:hypothetical protein
MLEITLERGPLDQPPPTCLKDPRKIYTGVAKMHFASGGSVVILGLHETNADIGERERPRGIFTAYRCASGAVILRAKPKVFLSGPRLLKFETKYKVYFFFYDLRFLDSECRRFGFAPWLSLSQQQQIEMCGELSKQRFIDRHTGITYILWEKDNVQVREYEPQGH